MLQRRLLVKMTKIESFLSSPESFELATSLPPAFVRLISNPTGIHLYNGLGWPGLPALCPIALAQALGLGLVLPVWPASFLLFLPWLLSMAQAEGLAVGSHGIPGTTGYCPRRNAWPR